MTKEDFCKRYDVTPEQFKSAGDFQNYFLPETHEESMEKRQFLKTYKGHEIYVTDEGKFTTILYNGSVCEVKVSETTLKNLTSEIDNFGLLIGIEYYVVEPFAGSIEKGIF